MEKYVNKIGNLVLLSKQKNKEATNTDLTNLTMNKSYMEIINNNKTKNQKSLKDIINHHFK